MVFKVLFSEQIISEPNLIPPESWAHLFQIEAYVFVQPKKVKLLWFYWITGKQSAISLAHGTSVIIAVETV